MSEDTTKEAAEASEKQQPQFGLKRIYVRDLSFESPNGVMGANNGKPTVNQDLNTQVDKIDDHHFEVILKLTVTVKFEEETTAFLAEVHQAGIFMITGLEGQQLQHAVTSSCPQILFPYAREAIDSLAVKGGFPPLALPPINFDALYAQAVSEAQERAKQENH